MTDKLAPRDTKATAAFLQEQVESGRRTWKRMCLSVQRQARGLPAVYPTALSAANATPKSERVYDVDDWRRGMVGFSYNPSIPGTAGHIFFVAGRKPDGTMVTCTNDAIEVGAMDYVPLDFYGKNWGQTVQFAATWLNGYDFADFNEPPKPVFAGNLGEQYSEAFRLLLDVLENKRRKFGPNAPIVKSLQRDVDRMRRKIARFNGDE